LTVSVENQIITLEARLAGDVSLCDSRKILYF